MLQQTTTKKKKKSEINSNAGIGEKSQMKIRDLKIYLSSVSSYEQHLTETYCTEDNVYEDTKHPKHIFTTGLVYNAHSIANAYRNFMKFIVWIFPSLPQHVRCAEFEIFWHQFMCIHKVLVTAPVVV